MAPPDAQPSPGSDTSTNADTALGRLDAWVAKSDWHPRIVPFVVYLAFLPVIAFATEYSLYAYPVFYSVQCLVVVWLLWRYRKLLGELNWKFHWLAIPTAVFLTAAWVGLGYMMTALSPWFETAGAPPERFPWREASPPPVDEVAPVGVKLHEFQRMRIDAPGLFYLSIGLRLLGMSLVVPMFEELFVRSLCLRALHSARKTAIGVLQVVHDMPMVGDWFMHTDWGKRAAGKEGMFMQQFHATPLGKLSLFGIAASTFVFMVHHVPRDWLGCIVCGIVWCWLLWYTNRGGLSSHAASGLEPQASSRKPRLGLGPIVWSHGLTNALLWGYTLWSDDWQFL